MPASVFEFGEFRLDCGRFELQRDGRTLRLERKPLELLILLAEKNGQLTSREEIAQRLWTSEVFVDTEHGINTAIRKIRYALRDDPEDARFIQTVTGKGYRFAAPIVVTPGIEVAAVENGAGSQSVSDGLKLAESSALQTEAATEPAHGGGGVERSSLAPPSSAGRRYWRALAAAAALALLAATVWYLLRPLPPPRITAYSQITHDGHRKFLGGTDGSRVFFVPFSPNFIAQISATGGEPSQVQVPVLGNMMGLHDVSPDGASFLVASGDEGNPFDILWNVRIMGGSVHRLGQANNAAYSPDGNWVAYSVANDGIYVARSDGSERREVTAYPESRPASLSWSPDSKSIQFEQTGEIWEISANGGERHPFMPGWRAPGGICCGRWTADGNLFLFVVGGASPAGGAGPVPDQIWALDKRHRLAGLLHVHALPVQLTSPPIHWLEIVRGKDPTKLFAMGDTLRGELTRYDAGTELFSAFLGGISAEFVAFSPDGKSVLYVSHPDGTLWKANRDGSSPVQLIDTAMYPINPRWSPDGAQISFTSDSPGKTTGFIVSAEGGSPQRILPHSSEFQADLNWSPDGKRILFSTESSGKQVLAILNLADGRVTAVPGSDGLYSPRWSADGRYIAALASSPPLRLFDFQTQQWRELPVAGDAEFPSFSRDGQSIYFLRYGRDQGVYRVRLNGHEAERIVDLKDRHFTGYFGYWLGLDPSDAPLLLRDIGSSDIYALTLDEK